MTFIQWLREDAKRYRETPGVGKPGYTTYEDARNAIVLHILDFLSGGDYAMILNDLKWDGSMIDEIKAMPLVDGMGMGDDFVRVIERTAMLAVTMDTHSTITAHLACAALHHMGIMLFG